MKKSISTQTTILLFLLSSILISTTMLMIVDIAKDLYSFLNRQKEDDGTTTASWITLVSLTMVPCVPWMIVRWLSLQLHVRN
mmetsp:Transcript_17962/g.26797  ORF Transcript_17962/g.26797 Transcript_17962/m.26797 type:complete len:82 (-) Transcript_17962:1008-1253(-)